MSDTEQTIQTIDYWINSARQIAITAHAGVFRSDKKTPYIKHVEAVASAVERRLQPIAWLHDVVEDTTVTLQDLINAKFPEYIIVAVDLLTHRASEPNMVYWNKIIPNSDASIVKVADIKHNLNDAPSENQIQKYTLALRLFADAGYSI